MCFGLPVFLNYPCASLPNLTAYNREYTVNPNLQMPPYCAQGQRQYYIALFSNAVLKEITCIPLHIVLAGTTHFQRSRSLQ